MSEASVMVRGQCAVGLFLLLQLPFKVIKLAGRVGLSRGVFGVFVGWYVEHLDSPVVVRYCTETKCNIVYVPFFARPCKSQPQLDLFRSTNVYLGLTETM